LQGGALTGIVAHPYSYRIVADYDRATDTMTLTPVSALQQVKEAFDDEGDSLAPDKLNDYGGFVVVGSAPGIEEFIDILELVGKFFSEQELIDLAEQIKGRWEKKEVETKLSKGLDFFGILMAQLFPAYADLLNKAHTFVSSINSGIISASSSLNDMTKFLEKKLSEGEEIAEDIKEFMDQFIFELSETGIYYKTFSEQKADEIKEELNKGMPSSWKTSKYSLVLSFLGGSGTVELIVD
ncbi:MAG: hypothetical protein KAS32_04395, partial [Candidatus Peribacteraceae bacterium]|nr:hypothetical protein [Candidatus Peribacteraceae bacterium]